MTPDYHMSDKKTDLNLDVSDFSDEDYHELWKHMGKLRAR